MVTVVPTVADVGGDAVALIPVQGVVARA